MTPYFTDGTVTLYHGDCRELLPALSIEPGAAVIADPPYGETNLIWDRWPVGWLSVLASSIDVGHLWCFGSMRMLLERLGEFAAWTYAQEVVWEKHNGSSLAADRFRRVHEFAFGWYRGSWADLHHDTPTTPDATARTVRRKPKPPHWQGARGASTYASEDGGPRLMRSVLLVRSCHGDAVHPTQKPLGILRPLITYSTPPDGLVLDPFAGSGSTRVAAQHEGRRAVGIEAREDYCEVAARRLAQGVLAL